MDPDALSELLHAKKRGRSEEGPLKQEPDNQASSINLHGHNVIQTSIKQLPFKRTGQRDPMLGSERPWHVSTIPTGSDSPGMISYAFLS